ncbi:MAG: hypothetical protein ABI432_07340 [Flavobacteriales bacterium]
MDEIKGYHHSQYVGKAGEHLVAAKLLRLGLNAGPLPIDSGVDILAHAELKVHQDILQLHAEHLVYQFQVKTTSTDEYSVSIDSEKFAELWFKVINLIVVFWPKDASPVCLVLPPSLCRMLSSGGFEDPQAPFVVTGSTMSLRVLRDGDRYYIRNKSNEVTRMLERFDRIEPTDTDTGMFPSYACWSGEEKRLVEIEDV